MKIKLNVKFTLVLCSALLMASLTGCGSAAKSASSEVPNGVSTTQDYDALASIVGKTLNLSGSGSSESESLSINSLGFTTQSFTTAQDSSAPSSLVIMGTTLPVNNNSVVFNNKTYRYHYGNADNDGTYWYIFDTQSENSNNYFELQVNRTATFLSNFVSQITTTTSDTSSTIHMTGDAMISYIDANTSATYATFNIQAMDVTQTIRGDDDYAGTLVFPFILTVKGRSYQGSFRTNNIQTDQITSALVSLDSNTNVGEITLTGTNQIIVKLRKANGDLEIVVSSPN